MINLYFGFSFPGRPHNPIVYKLFKLVDREYRCLYPKETYVGIEHVALKPVESIAGVDKGFAGVRRMRPASCILLYHQLAVVMLQPARCTELFPVHIDGGILVVFLYPVPYVLFPAQANEFIQINVGYPACLIFCFLETIFVGRQLAELYGPFRQGDLSFLYIGSKDVLIIVLRKLLYR